MELVGIVAEYNPFHNGHALQISQLRKKGAKMIAVCMSASATQRGEVPLLPNSVRAAAALASGADIVLALPAPYACAGAEAFAAAGVHLLAAMGCDTIACGAETPDVERVYRTAKMLLSDDFRAELKQHQTGNQTFAQTRAQAAETLLPGSAALLAEPNNILAVEYAKALQKSGAQAELLVLPRYGTGHDGQAAGQWQECEVASASLLRWTMQQQKAALLMQEGNEAMTARGQSAEWQRLACFVPASAMELYQTAMKSGQCLEETAFSTALLSRLRGKTAAEFAEVRGVGEGLENRLFAAVQRAGTAEELAALLKTKRYPAARLRRLVLDAALGYAKELLPVQPPYLQVLGAKRKSLNLLQAAKLPASPSLARLAKTNAECAAVARAQSAATDFSALCRVQPMPCGLAFTAKPVL